MWLVLTASALTYAYGQTSEIPKKVDQINRGLKRLGGPEVCISCAFPEGKDLGPSAWKDCLQQVCGNQINREEKDLQRILDADMKKHPEFAEVLPLVKDAFKSELEVKAAGMRIALQALKDFKPWTDPVSLAVAAQTQALLHFDKLSFDPNGEVNETQSMNLLSRSDIPASQIQLTLMLAKKISSRIYPNPYSIFLDDFEYIRQELSATEIKKQIDQVVARSDDLTAKLSQISKVPRVLTFSPIVAPPLRDRFRSGDFTAKDIEELKDSWQLNEILWTLFSDPDLLKHGRAAGFNPQANLPVAYARNLQKIESFLDGHKNSDTLDLHAQELRELRTCFSTFALASELLPSARDVNRYEKHDEPTLRKKFFKKLKPYLSTESASTIAKEMGQWQLRPPESKEALGTRLKRNLQSLKSNNDLKLAEMKKPLSNEARQRLAALQIRFADSPLAEDLHTLCAQNRPKLMDDYARALDGKFHVSGRTTMGGAEADFILNHEYSHLISGAIVKEKAISEATRKWYDITRRCLAQGHPEKDSERVEEDFADMLAASFAGGSRLFCEGIPETEADFTLKNWNVDDKAHSGHFFRVLHARVLTGEGIPDVCKVALAEKGETPFERNCLKETPEASVR